MRTPILCSVLLVTTLGCRGPDDVHDGTSVGNPTSTMLRIAPVEGLDVAEAIAPVGDIVLVGCGTPAEQLVFDGPLSLLDGEIALPGGRWCAVEMGLFEPIHLYGTGADGGTFDLALDVGFVYLEAGEGWEIDGEIHVWEFGGPGWLSDTELGVTTGVDVLLGPEDLLHEELVGRVHVDSGIYVDNGDGVVEFEEREAGEVAHAPPPPEDTDEPGPEGCGGCESAPARAGGGWILFALASAVVRRRR